MTPGQLGGRGGGVVIIVGGVAIIILIRTAAAATLGGASVGGVHILVAATAAAISSGVAGVAATGEFLGAVAEWVRPQGERQGGKEDAGGAGTPSRSRITSGDAAHRVIVVVTPHDARDARPAVLGC